MFSCKEGLFQEILENVFSYDIYFRIKAFLISINEQIYYLLHPCITFCNLSSHKTR
jgi:hypothetical protein